MILHTVNKSPYSSQCFADCLRTASTGDIIILIEDGVYGARGLPLHSPSPPIEDMLKQKKSDIELYVLQPDLEARGLFPGAKTTGFILVDDRGFVDLAVKADKILSWY